MRFSIFFAALFRFASAELINLDSILDGVNEPESAQPPKYIANLISDFLETLPSALPSEVPSTFPTLSLRPSTSPSFYPSDEPSFIPSNGPTYIPSSPPTLSPSENPSRFPSSQPSDFPTDIPTHNPSFTPTSKPSSAPSSPPSISSHPTSPPSISPSNTPSETKTGVPSFSPTESRKSSHWNYDISSRYGPNAWERVNRYDPIYQKASQSSSSNKCISGTKQSPIVLKAQNTCRDDHQTHTERGNKNFDELEFQVLPHALRVVFPPEESWGKKPPRADFSNLSPFIPAIFMDVKIPSEHHILDESGIERSYPGEIQIVHSFSSNKKMVIMGFFFDYESDEFNEQFEDFITQWEDIFFEQEHKCQQNKNPYAKRYQKRSYEEMVRLWGDHRNWAGSADFDVYRLIPTVYYYGYSGSTTAPPCSENVHYRFQDLPMKISRDQYLRIQKVILDQKNANCRRSSRAFNGGVNRPIQKNNIQAWRCTTRHWDIRDPLLWCGKWPQNYHAAWRLKGICPEHS